MASQRAGAFHADDKLASTDTARTTGVDDGTTRGAEIDEKGSGHRSSEASPMDEKHGDIEEIPHYDEEAALHRGSVVQTAEDLVTQVLEVQDNPHLSPWTFRMWFWGIGLSVFGSVLQEIYFFKPQTVYVSLIFIVVISYVGGNFFELVIPRRGFIGKWLNPFSFNSKEHTAIIIMASSAATSALATEVLAVQRLWYTSSPNAGSSVFLMFSSQLIGYGIAGFLRRTLVYPTKMLYPINLPINTLLETLHRDKAGNKRRFKFFWTIFFILFVWEVIPEYIMPILTGVSIFCLAKRDSLVFTNLFGGSNGNEGLGFLSWSMDWQYIAGLTSPLWYPLQTLANNFVGYILCISMFMGVYYMGIWRSRDFPFLSQLLFDGNLSNSTSYVQYNQSMILNDDSQLDEAKLASYGLPYFASTYVATILTSNMAVTAGLVHMFLWNYDDLKTAWTFMNWSNLRRITKPSTWSLKYWKTDGSVEHTHDIMEDDKMDPHYKLMSAYKDVPDWWFGIVLIASFVVGMIVIYTCNSTLPWWGFIISLLISSICILFFGALYGISGFFLNAQPLVQLIGAYCHPGRPLANMYFTLYGYNSQNQGLLLLRDLKLAQYAHLSPRCTFTMQIIGTLIGCLFNYVMMVSITDNQREVLLSIEGTNIWSGQVVQTYNSQAVAWGGLAKHLFSVGGRYQWVSLAFLIGFVVPLPTYFLHKLFPRARFDYWNTGIICWYLGWLCVGINSSIMPYFALGWFSQFYLRRYHARWFVKYNYLLSAAMDGGTQVIVFILTFAVFGGSGSSVTFPSYWGNNRNSGNYDYCMFNPANAD